MHTVANLPVIWNFGFRGLPWNTFGLTSAGNMDGNELVQARGGGRQTCLGSCSLVS